MANYIVGGILILIVGYVSYYIYRQKKKGVQCIGCPSANSCTKKTCQAFNTDTIQQIKKDIQTKKK